MPELTVVPLAGMPLFAPGMSVAGEVAAALARGDKRLGEGDVIVVAQKIVSKAEGRLVNPGDVAPGDDARALAAKTGREPALAQLILDESSDILRATPAAIIARHNCGHILANAGIDASNVAGDAVLLWPRDPDASARAIRVELVQLTGVKAGVVIADSLGRAWRIGTVGAAIGCAGLTVLDDQRGKGQDLFGRTMQATVIAVADAIAAMAVLAMGEGAEGTPAALVRGAGQWVGDDDGPGAAQVLRPLAEDMFR